MEKRFTGLIAAVFTPMCKDGSLNLGQVPPIVEHLTGTEVSGIFVCGTTGEGPSLSSEERRATAAAYVKAAAAKLPVMVQVGHNSLAESHGLASHAQAIGADAISAMPPARRHTSSSRRSRLWLIVWRRSHRQRRSCRCFTITFLR